MSNSTKKAKDSCLNSTSATEESYSTLQNEINDTCKTIEKFIKHKSNKYHDSEVFKTLIALHSLFNAEIERGMKLRNAIIKYKGELSQLEHKVKSLIPKTEQNKYETPYDIINKVRYQLNNLEDISAQNAMEMAELTSVAETANKNYKNLLNKYEELQQTLKNERTERFNLVPSYQVEFLQKKNDELTKENFQYRQQIEQLQKKLLECKQYYTDKAAVEVELIAEKEKSKGLRKQNEESLEKLNMITDSMSKLESAYTDACFKLQTDVTELRKRCVLLETEIKQKDAEIFKIQHQASNGNQSVKERKGNNKNYQQIFKDICKLMGVSDCVKPEKLIDIISKLIRNKDDLSYSSDEYPEEAPTLRNLILVALTCNRLLKLMPDESDLLVDLKNVQKEITEIKNQIIKNPKS